MTQYIIIQGLEVFDNKGEALVWVKLKQFRDCRFVEPKKPQDLSYKQRRRSLSYLIFLELKIDEVKTKVRRCADGRKYWDWLSKEDTFLPTVSTEGLVLSCMIDAMEGREVATSDIPGTFLHTDYGEGYIHIKLEGFMFTLLQYIDPEYYKSFIYTDKRGRNCMYEKFKEAIYGKIEMSLLFWGGISKSLE